MSIDGDSICRQPRWSGRSPAFPKQIETDNEEAYWELEKFIRLALKANPSVLECLYSPIVETCISPAGELIEMRQIFLSQYVHRTYNAYVLSQFKKLEQDLRNSGQIRWKHVMHLIRLLLSGVEVLRHGISDYDTVHAFQKGMLIMPLSQYPDGVQTLGSALAFGTA
jgi:predicted nucleotidyltransferase